MNTPEQEAQAIVDASIYWAIFDEVVKRWLMRTLALAIKEERARFERAGYNVQCATKPKTAREALAGAIATIEQVLGNVGPFADPEPFTGTEPNDETEDWRKFVAHLRTVSPACYDWEVCGHLAAARDAARDWLAAIESGQIGGK